MGAPDTAVSSEQLGTGWHPLLSESYYYGSNGDAGGGSSYQLLASTLCPALAWHIPVFIL